MLAKKNVKAHRFKSQLRPKFDRKAYTGESKNSDFPQDPDQI